MYLSILSSALVLLGTSAGTLASTHSHSNQSLVSDINFISQQWGQISSYSDNPFDAFGVKDVGLPAGCQVEQAHTLQRHAQRFPTSYVDDGILTEDFAQKVVDFRANSSSSFSGPLSFLNSYKYQMNESYLTSIGARTEFGLGVDFWNRYGRILYNASAGQVSYDTNLPNGTARPKPVLRTTSQSRIRESQINWALGFFGPTYETVPVPKLTNYTSGDFFDLVIIPEGGTENNTLASYDSCFNDFLTGIGDLGDQDVFTYIPRYLQSATSRLQKYVPADFKLSTNNTYAMQLLCAYEHGFLGMSDFCDFFTADEWYGFESTLDIAYYYDYGYGNPTGRAQGIGYVQELLARLTHQYIFASNSSVNSSITNNSRDFPLDRPFYADFSHDDIIVSVLTAMSLDYFRDPPSLTEYPPNPDRHFVLSKMTPFGGHLVTEVIGCASPNPTAVAKDRVQYYPEQYGYSPSNATHKFVRMRLNSGILPLDTLRGGACKGRTDGLCALDKFVASQNASYALSNYDYACFGNWTVANTTNGHDYDGTVYLGQAGILENTQPPASSD
ncbi:phosphoglycerate mutase-like protein [Aureobasidium namibiae CBS 147.97]|uniref:Phosphoglycerate mutase-like protein n=1 Tax=Aureobasidium namibiae CBS 147.97 TaxID=1043004 RepID=A0A074WP18_9PEZI